VTCQPKQCGVPAVFSERDVTCNNGYSFGKNCSFSCKAAFNLEGKPHGNNVGTLMCTAAGIWVADGTPPATCQVIDCCDPTKIGDPSIIVLSGWTDTTIGGKGFNYQCSPGYKGTNGFGYCTADDGWKISATCAPIACNPPAPVAGVNLGTCTNYTFGASCSFTCATGYDITPPSSTGSITCKANGDWDNHGVTCPVHNCLAPALTGFDFTVPACTNTTYTAKCQFKCATGYDMSAVGGLAIGLPLATCTATVWDTNSVTCSIHNCGALPTTPGYVFKTASLSTTGGTADFTCAPGYHYSVPQSALFATFITCTGAGWRFLNTTCDLDSLQAVPSAAHPNPMTPQFVGAVINTIEPKNYIFIAELSAVKIMNTEGRIIEAPTVQVTGITAGAGRSIALDDSSEFAIVAETCKLSVFSRTTFGPVFTPDEGFGTGVCINTPVVTLPDSTGKENLIAPTGAPAGFHRRFNLIQSIAISPKGDVYYILEQLTGRILKITTSWLPNSKFLSPAATIENYADLGLPVVAFAPGAQMYLDSTGNLFVPWPTGDIIRVDAATRAVSIAIPWFNLENGEGVYTPPTSVISPRPFSIARFASRVLIADRNREVIVQTDVLGTKFSLVAGTLDKIAGVPAAADRPPRADDPPCAALGPAPSDPTWAAGHYPSHLDLPVFMIPQESEGFVFIFQIAPQNQLLKLNLGKP